MRLVRVFDCPIICGHCASVSFSLCLSLMLFVLCLSLLHFLPQRSRQRGGGCRCRVWRPLAQEIFLFYIASTRNWATGQAIHIKTNILLYVVHINKLITCRSTYEVCSKEKLHSLIHFHKQNTNRKLST